MVNKELLTMMQDWIGLYQVIFLCYTEKVIMEIIPEIT